MRRTALLVLLLFGCKEDPPAPLPSPDPTPEQTGRFLNEPAGVPPAALPPAHIELHVGAATDPTALRTQLSALTAGAGVWPAEGAADVAALSALRVPAPILRTRFDGGLQQDELVALLKGGVRGNVVLWYPLMDVRERLNDGRAGVWRGITRLREELPTKGARLGGTPVLHLGVVAALDAPMLQQKIPAGYTAVIRREDWDSPHSASLFTAPDGSAVAWLLPKSGVVIEGTFDQAVESLVPVVKQGGKAWLLIALPLAEERKPERH